MDRDRKTETPAALRRLGRRLLPLFFLVAFGAGLAACGGGSQGGGAAGGGASSEGPAAGGEKTILVVGSDAAYAPFEYVNEKGEIVGWDIDLIHKLGELGGFQVEIRNLPWDSLFQEVKNGGVDAAISAITITDDRKLTYDFSDPYYVAHQLVLVPEDSPIQTLEDLKTKARYVGVQNATTGHIVAQNLLGKTSPKIKAYESTPLAIQDMLGGNTDAVIADNAVVIEYVKNNPKAKLRYFDDPSFEKEYYGIMVKKGNAEVLDRINAALKKAKEEGVIREIFGADVE
ncbi:basic amino acid ABC transporter substrate-binding protein [Hydrogenibacillus schlegelii]|uniref:basic amino acid ABC transporter substrate-binding protein n=1 Tax=Hydrogenibacillus schlegelii TaxID=1484 RepID=UPI0009E946D4|nr:basic amino acid ABC transporter substrate-binding protein [Hydrogenibacillus schlegelii]